jgi:hypothetical protein
MVSGSGFVEVEDAVGARPPTRLYEKAKRSRPAAAMHPHTPREEHWRGGRSRPHRFLRVQRPEARISARVAAGNERC